MGGTENICEDVTALREGDEETGDGHSGAGGVMVTMGVWRAALPVMARQVVGEVEVAQVVEAQEVPTEAVEVMEEGKGGGGMLVE